MNARRFLLAATLSCITGAASAQAIDAARSSVSATFKQMGVPVEGKFKKVGGQVGYDPANPTAAQAKVDVDVASFDLGDAQYNHEVQQKDWFDGTMTYLAERYHELNPKQIAELRILGERFSQPAKVKAAV